MLNGRRPRFERPGTASADGQQIVDTGIQVAASLLTRKAFTKRYSDGPGHGLAR